MATDILQQLLTGGSSNQGVSPELLETLGKQAAQRFLKDETSLNESIVKLASEYPGIQNEHVKRISEFANNAVFQKMHSDSADKNVHFDVADPGVIIRDLKDGGSPNHDGKTLNNGPSQGKTSGHPAVGDGSNYRKPPGYESSPSSDQGFQDLSSAFTEFSRQDNTSGVEGTGEPISKTAAAAPVVVDHELHADPIHDVHDADVRLRATEEKLKEAHECFDLILKQAEEEFYQAAKSECLNPEGSGLSGVTQVVKLAAPSHRFAFQILKPVAERLVKEGAVRSSEMSKTASMNRVVNTDHPLFRTFSGIVKAANERDKSALALDEVQKSREQTQGFLQSLR